MITEDYVSFEIAKLLKEKGFDIYVRSYYEKNEYRINEEFNTNEALWNWNISSFRYSAPTLQMAMKWLRETHKIGIFPSIYSSHSINYSEKDSVKHSFGTAIISLSNYELMTDDIMPMPTYEEACEAGIRYCLENLI